MTKVFESQSEIIAQDGEKLSEKSERNNECPFVVFYPIMGA